MVSEKTNLLYRDILRRIYAEENYERLRVFHNPDCSDDEDRIWDICSNLWPKDISQRTFIIDQWEIDPAMDDLTAKRYLKELELLLNKLNWA